jgi:hypothetical protein
VLIEVYGYCFIPHTEELAVELRREQAMLSLHQGLEVKADASRRKRAKKGSPREESTSEDGRIIHLVLPSNCHFPEIEMAEKRIKSQFFGVERQR